MRVVLTAFSSRFPFLECSSRVLVPSRLLSLSCFCWISLARIPPKLSLPPASTASITLYQTGVLGGPSLTSALRRHGQSLSADVLHVKASFRSPTLASGSVPHLVSQDQVSRQQAHHALSVPRALLLHYSCSSKNDSCWGNHAASLPRPDLGLSLHGWSGLPGSFPHPFIYLLTHQLHRGSGGPGLSPTLETDTHTGWTLRLTESTGSVREAGLISSGAVLRVFWCTGK